MNCNECTTVNTINRCANTIYIPDITGTADADYMVVITDTATGRAENINVTAVNNTLTVPIEFEFMDGHTYEVRVYEGEDFNEQREITIGVTTACCVQFQTKDLGLSDTYEILSLDTCE
jgi:hypothetical protein